VDSILQNDNVEVDSIQLSIHPGEDTLVVVRHEKVLEDQLQLRK
jgi:hypothetical protein